MNFMTVDAKTSSIPDGQVIATTTIAPAVLKDERGNRNVSKNRLHRLVLKSKSDEHIFCRLYCMKVYLNIVKNTSNKNST